MGKTYEELLEQAAVIRDETKANANTAKRVGGALADVVDFIKNSPLAKDYTPEIEAASAAANSAAQKAEEAKTSASSAYTLARTANTNALSANATATEAKTKAEAAHTTATQAQSKATEAQTTATQAINKANDTYKEFDDFANQLDGIFDDYDKGGNGIPWNSSTHINSFVESKNYYIHGERTNAKDGLPILNADPGHTIFAQLSVLDSSLTSGTGAKTDICVTQVLRLSNRTGGDGHVYVRTGQAATKAELTATNSTKWGTWEKLMGIFEKNVVADPSYLDTYTTNGMYSGLFMFDASHKLHCGFDIPFGSTFLLVTVNGYAASAFNFTPQITQMMYILPTKNMNKLAEIYLRTAYWDAAAKAWVWGDWDKIVTASELSALEARVTALEKK